MNLYFFTLPLVLCKIKFNLFYIKLIFYLTQSIACLYILPFFKFLLNITSDILLDNPIIFIYMTIYNIILLYVIYLSSFDKNRNLIENIIYLFNSLKECKFCPFKIKLLLINIVIHLKERIYIKFKQKTIYFLFY